MRSTTTAFCVLLFAALPMILLVGCGKSKTSTPSSTETAASELDKLKMASAENLQQIGIAMHNSQATMQTFPSAGRLAGKKSQPGDFNMPYSWRVHILPYIEQENLYRLAFQDFMANPDAQLPAAVSKTTIKLYQNPLGKDHGSTATHYRVFVGNGAAFEYGRGVRPTEFTDGLSKTILVVESAEPVDWSKIDELVYDPKKPLPKLGIFPGGFHVLMADGSVHWIPSETDEKIIRAMITRSGNETFEMPGTRVKFDREIPAGGFGTMSAESSSPSETKPSKVETGTKATSNYTPQPNP